ncbi:MAG: hypothetical protein NVS3B21_02950 [Acidimicrobiales bacterium]
MESERTEADWSAWIGHEVLDKDGTKVGTVGEIYLDNETGQPEWIAVKTGLFGHSHSLAPLAGAGRQDDVIRLGQAKDLLDSAPRAQSKDGVLTPDEEAHLYDHYGLGTTAQTSESPAEPTERPLRLRPYGTALSTEPPVSAEPRRVVSQQTDTEDRTVNHG